MAMAALRLRRHRLLTDPIRSISIRIEPHIEHLRGAAAASPSSPCPTASTHPGSSVHQHRHTPPSPCSASPAALSSHRPPSPRSAPCAASVASRRTPSPGPVHFAPSASLHRSSPPRPKPSPFSIGDHCPSAGERCRPDLLPAGGAGPRALPKGMEAALHPLGMKAAPRVFLEANPQVSVSRSLLGSAQKRFFSDVPGSPEEASSPKEATSPGASSSKEASSPEAGQSRLSPVSQLAFREDSQVSVEEWVEPIPYLTKHLLLVDLRENHLNMEISGFADNPQYCFSEDTGIPLFQSLVLLALINNNRGYCVKWSFTIDNLLLCPKLKQFRFKDVDWEDLNVESEELNRSANYKAVRILMWNLLRDTMGLDTLSYLLDEPRDLFAKLWWPSDERLIIYHPSFLSVQGRIWMYKRLYWFYFSYIPFAHMDLRKTAVDALGELAYTSTTKRNVVHIIMSHPLLLQIETKRLSEQEKKTGSSRRSSLSQEEKISGLYEKQKHAFIRLKPNQVLGKKIIALPRHTIEHAFDKETRKVLSKHSTDSDGNPKRLWRYSDKQVVELLCSILPAHLPLAQEIFLVNRLWTHLEMENGWPRDLTWMGEIPEPTPEVQAAIDKIPYGTRREQVKAKWVQERNKRHEQSGQDDQGGDNK